MSCWQEYRLRISIHALREEGDRHSGGSYRQRTDFYPRPPRGGRPGGGLHRSLSQGFLSTPSARRATLQAMADPDKIAISIHALREEGDRKWSLNWMLFLVFLSTPSARRATRATKAAAYKQLLFLSMPSARRATCPREREVRVLHISIHALREEGDSPWLQRQGASGNFYPRPPRGGRPKAVAAVGVCGLFLSTPSARRATDLKRWLNGTKPISIHALREEGDKLALGAADVSDKFLSTPSARRATRDG